MTPEQRARVEFDVFHDNTTGDKATPWAVIYRRNGGPWGRYQSHVVNEATARAIADALQAASLDPEDPS